MAAVFCASLRRRAIVWRSASCARALRAERPRSDDGTRGATGAAAAAGQRRRRRGPWPASPSTSPFSTWPSLAGAGDLVGRQVVLPASWQPPVPAAWLRATAAAPAAECGQRELPWARRIRRGAAPLRQPPAPSPRWRPAARRRRRSRLACRRARGSTPAAGAGTSTVTLSVSSSTSGSSAFTASPALLEPLADGRFGDGFTEVRDTDFGSLCHLFFTSRQARLRGTPGAALLCLDIRPVAGSRRQPDCRCSARAGAWRRYGRAPIR
jgi:hypothetical protein